MTWTPDKIKALAKSLLDYIDGPDGCSVPFDEIRESASALTWALERIGELEGELNHFRDPLMQPSQRYWEGRWRDAEAERDAANARADAIPSEAEICDIIARNCDDTQVDLLGAAREILAHTRALKGARK